MSLSPDPARLLDAARQLAAVATPESLRRATSTAYYALFHCMAGHAADRFVGLGDTSPAYAMFYRSLDHSKMRTVLAELAKSSFRPSLRKALGRTTSTARQEVEELIDEAARALLGFSALDPVEQTELLALMVAGARS